MLALEVDHHIRKQNAPTPKPVPDAHTEIALVDVELLLVDLPKKADEDAFGDPFMVTGGTSLHHDDAVDELVLLLLRFGPNEELIRGGGTNVMKTFHRDGSRSD